MHRTINSVIDFYNVLYLKGELVSVREKNNIIYIHAFFLIKGYIVTVINRYPLGCTKSEIFLIIQNK